MHRHHDNRRRHDEPRDRRARHPDYDSPDYDSHRESDYDDRRFDQTPFEPDREGWSVRLPNQGEIDDDLYRPAARWPIHAHSPRERDTWQRDDSEHRGGPQGFGPRTGRFEEPRWAPARAQGPWDPPAYEGAYDQHRFAPPYASWHQRHGHSPRPLHPGPKGYTRPDERIREEVCDRLWQAGELDASDVEVSVEKGEVTLTGSVPVRAMKYAIEDLCDHVGGVVEIHNQLRVRRGDTASS